MIILPIWTLYSAKFHMGKVHNSQVRVRVLASLPCWPCYHGQKYKNTAEYIKHGLFFYKKAVLVYYIECCYLLIQNLLDFVCQNTY